MKLFTKDVPDEVKHSTIFERGVPLKSMFVHFRTLDGGYARPLNIRRVNKLVSEWDSQAVGILLLSLRDNGLFANIDGQHRAEAARRVGIKALDAYVYIDLSLKDEARLYSKFGDYLKQTARDRYIAMLAEGKPEIVAINRILATRGLHVVPGGGQVQNGVQAIESVLAVAHMFGPTVLRATIDLLHDAWGSEPRAYVGTAVKGTAHFLARFGESGSYNRQRMIDRMQREGIAGVERRANNWLGIDRTSNVSAWGKALMSLHDSGNVQFKLGSWPERHLNEFTRTASRVNITNVNERRRQATPDSDAKRAYRERAFDVKCPTCRAPAGQQCIGRQMKSVKTPHDQRCIAASAARRSE